MACGGDWGRAFFDAHMNTSADRGVGDDTRNQAINDKTDAVALVSSVDNNLNAEPLPSRLLRI